MAIKGFNYEEFAKNLTDQAKEIVPADFNDNQKQFVVNTLYNFSNMAGKALSEDKESGFTADQAMMITQIIAEWSFHKSVDLIRSGIPQQFWDPIMQKIAYTIFEIAQQTFKQNLPQDQILQLIEHHVKKAYDESIKELKDRNLIDEALMEKAVKQSNIDSMMQQMQEEPPAPPAAQPAPQPQAAHKPSAQAPQGGAKPVPAGAPAAPVDISKPIEKYKPPKLLKLVAVALLLKRVTDDRVQSILNHFEQDDAGTVLRYMYVDNLEEKVDPSVTMRVLEDIGKNLPSATEVNTNLLVERVKTTASMMDRQKLEALVQLERPNVRRFVFNALEGEFYKMSPRVAAVIASHLEHSV